MNKKTNVNIFLVIGIVYIAVMVTWSATFVGRPVNPSPDVYQWHLPLTMFLILLPPLLCGILSERYK